MTVVERRNAILETLKEQGIVDVNALTSQLEVSKVTIRTDLDDLESRGLLVRTHGGAILPENQKYVRLISNTINEFPAEKERIGHLASLMVKQGMTIIIDSGSTTLHVADDIAERHPSMVVTNSLLVVDKLHTETGFEMLIAGGLFRKEGMSAIGSYTCDCINMVHADMLFLGASGVSLEEGVSCTNLIEADVKKAMIRHATTVVLLTDSSKIGKVALAHVCDWSSIDWFITDAIDAKTKKTLESLGVNVLVASAAGMDTSEGGVNP